MSYATGSHRGGLRGGTGPDDAEMDRFEAELRALGVHPTNYRHFSAGDVAVHAGWTLHAARTNTTTRAARSWWWCSSGTGRW